MSNIAIIGGGNLGRALAEELINVNLQARPHQRKQKEHHYIGRRILQENRR